MESARKRKSFVLEPQTPSTSFHHLNDDAQETEERRNLRREKSKDTPSTIKTKDLSIGRAKLAKMTATEKLEHTEKCIQLSAANKISTKNAFSLLLIDQMVELVKGEEANFQVASTHLDASTKIYAARVDKVHADVLRFAGGLSSNKPRTAVQDGDESGGEEEGVAPIEGADGVAVVKAKKKRRSRTVIQKDPKVLKSTAHLRTVNISDLYLQQLLTSQEASEPGNSHFLLTLPITGDNYKMLLQGDGLAFSSVCPELPSECAARVPDFRVCLPLPLLPAEIQSMLVEGDLDGTQSRIAPLFLPSADPEEEDDDLPADEFGVDDFADNDGGDRDEEPEWLTEEVRSGGQAAMVNGRDNMIGAGDAQSSRLLMPLDYMNLYRVSLGLSTGSRDWKPPRPRPSAIIRPVAAKRARNRGPSENDFEYHVGHFSELSGSTHTELSKATIEGWHRSNHLIPSMPDPQRGKRFQNFWMRNRCTPQSDQGSEGQETALNGLDNGPLVVDLDSSFSKFVSAADSDDGCDHDDDDVDHMDDAETLHAAGCGATAPELQPLNYAKRAKGIDMRMLKRCTWDILLNNLGDKENTSPSNETTFTKIYAQLPAKLSTKMATNLSPALAFMSVLHLANEHCLELTNPPELTELYVRKGSNQNI